MLTKLTLGMLGTAALAGVYVAQEGVVGLSVDEQGRKGTHLHLLVPAALVPLGMGLVPDEKLREVAAQARPWLPAVRIASAELARLPDSDLLDVREPERRVSIVKRGNSLVLDVHSPHQSVHISFPLGLATRVANRLESLAPTSQGAHSLPGPAPRGLAPLETSSPL